MKKKLLCVLLAAALAVTTAGCGTYEDSGDSSSGTTSAESASGDSSASGDTEKVFRYAIGTEPSSLDPDLSNAVDEAGVQHGIVEGLVRNTNGTISEGIAEKWDISDDGLTYTFYLRDAYWSDGEPITADDFVYGWRRLMDPATGSLYASNGVYILNGQAIIDGEKDPSELGVTAIDDHTLEVKLENPTTYFLGIIGIHSSFAPVRQDLVEQYGTDFASTPDKNVYSGPFVLTSAENQEYILEKNEHYWNADAINLDRVEISVVESSETELALFESGELDFAQIPTADVEQYADDEREGSYPSGSAYWFFLNTENEFLSNQNMRLALNYAINRTNYIALATNGVQEAFNRIVHPNLAGVSGKYGDEYSVDTYPLEGDETKAKEYLATALSELGYSDPSDVTLTITTQDDEGAKKKAEVAQEMWTKTLGINVEINQVTYNQLWGETLPNNDYDIGWGGWNADYDDPYSFLELFKSDGAYRYSPYENTEVDTLLNNALSEADATARMEMLNEAEQILLNDGVIVPLEMTETHYLLNQKVTGLEFCSVSIALDYTYVDIEE